MTTLDLHAASTAPTIPEAPAPARTALSVIVPARDEAENLPALVAELAAALDAIGLPAEIVIVDDGSRDGSGRVLAGLAALEPRVRAFATPPRGQSAALATGIRESRGAVIAMLDADLQNDPADLGRLLEVLDASGADLVQGDRGGARRDGFRRRVSSGVGRAARRLLLGDSIRDTGCTLRVMRREVALALPLELRGLHRFVPLLARALGHVVVEHPVGHRPRRAGRTKYGILNRAPAGLVDCLAVRWILARRRPLAGTRIEPIDATRTR